MSEETAERLIQRFGWPDYCVFAAMLGISAVIGGNNKWRERSHLYKVSLLFIYLSLLCVRGWKAKHDQRISNGRQKHGNISGGHVAHCQLHVGHHSSWDAGGNLSIRNNVLAHLRLLLFDDSRVHLHVPSNLLSAPSHVRLWGKSF